MTGTFKNAIQLILLAMLLAAVALAAPNQISRVGLSHEGGFTVMTIEGERPVRIAHQSVEAKEGKPYRIVIDCLAARHALPDGRYDELPSCIVSSIRSSQYAVTPEEVVRVVLDLKEQSVYRVENDGNRVQVYISDTKAGSFAGWSSPRATGFTPKQAPAEKTPVIEDKPAVPPQASVTPQKAAKPVPSVAVAQPSSQPKPTPKVSSSAPTVVAQKPIAASESRQPSTPARNDDIVPPADKPVPLQEKLGLTTAQAPAPKKAEPQKPAQPQTVVVQKAEPQKPAQPQTVVAQKAEPQKPAQPQTVVAQKAEPQKPAQPQVIVAATPPAQPKVSLKQDLANDSIARAMTFAAAAQQANDVPTPGPAPKTTGEPATDTHKAPAPKQANEKPALPQPKGLPGAAPATRDNVYASVEPAAKKPAAPKSVAPPSKPAAKSDDASGRTAETTNNPSRFRRDAAKSVRMKQSQVVQFPQRIVIKYKGSIGRDPFATLIDVDKKTSGVGSNSVPNVETLNLVGILEAVPGGKDAALMEDRDGIGYILRPGDRVRNGHVAQIQNNAIYFQINEYGWSRTVTKHLDDE